jgi:hypothetical protein
MPRKQQIQFPFSSFKYTNYFLVSHQVRTLPLERATVCGFVRMSSSCPRTEPLINPSLLSKTTQRVQLWIKRWLYSSVLSDSLSDSPQALTNNQISGKGIFDFLEPKGRFDCPAPKLQIDQQTLWPTTHEPHRRWRGRISRRVPLVGSP